MILTITQLFIIILSSGQNAWAQCPSVEGQEEDPAQQADGPSHAKEHATSSPLYCCDPDLLTLWVLFPLLVNHLCSWLQAEPPFLKIVER